MKPTFERDAANALQVAAMIAGQVQPPAVVALTVARGECSWERSELPADVDALVWLRASDAADAVVIDLRTPGEARLIHADATQRIPLDPNLRRST